MNDAALSEQVERLESEVRALREELARVKAAGDPLGDAAALKAIYDEAPIGLCVLSTDLRWLNINKQLAQINGLPVSAHIGVRVRDLLPGLADEVERIRDHILATGNAVHGVEITGETPQMPGVQRTWEESWTPVFDEQGAIVAINVAAREVTQEKRLQQSLRASEEMFRILADHVPSVVYLVDVPTRRLEYICPMYETIWGASRQEILDDLTQWTKMLHPDDRQAVLDARTRFYETGNLERFEYRIIRPSDGALRHIRDIAVPVRDAHGAIRRVVGVANDVTEQRYADDRRQLILQELAHRLKNTISTVLAIARMTLADTTSPSALLDFERRVVAAGRAQTLLVRGDSDRSLVEDVVRTALSAFVIDDSALATQGPPLELPPRVAFALSLTLHELGTNAVKYGALSGSGGKVSVTWTNKSGVLRMMWRESGGPPVATPSKRGFGSQLIEKTFAFECGGRVSLDFRPGGLVCEIEAGLSPDARRGQGAGPPAI